MRDALMLELAREEKVEIAGKVQQVRRSRLVAMALIKAALKEDIPAIKEIYNRVDGMLVAPDPSVTIQGGSNADARTTGIQVTFVQSPPRDD